LKCFGLAVALLKTCLFLKRFRTSVSFKCTLKTFAFICRMGFDGGRSFDRHVLPQLSSKISWAGCA